MKNYVPTRETKEAGKTNQLVLIRKWPIPDSCAISGQLRDLMNEDFTRYLNTDS